MERQGPGSDPAEEWGPHETGLEDARWQLGIGEGGDVAYPERPGEADCTYYLRTGYCGYGPRCRFNHPPDRMVVGVTRAAGVEFPERTGQPVCQFYMRTGMCKFGASCKYDHPRQGSGSATPLAINFSGYPLRPGEKECAYYTKTGQCKFGVTCKFHHPQPGGVQVQAPMPFGPSPVYQSMQNSHQYGVVSGNWPVSRPAFVPAAAGSYVQGPYSPMMLHQGMVSLSAWSPYQAPLSQVGSPTTQSTVGIGPSVYGITHLSASAPAYTGAYLPVPSTTGPSSSSNHKEQKFPERPGQADCQYYIKNGDCKFGSSCRYHHPPEWSPPNLSFTLSPLGFPLRPGAPLCAHYAQNGMCKFGQACKFDHPMGTLSYSPSASSLTDMPVAPYPVGSSLGTLAPSSSSSDLPVSNKDTVFTKKPSSVGTPSGSVGSIMSKSSGQASLSKTTSSSKSQGGDVHTSS